jgi:tetratricopeptide (TPR) repeat protein
MPHASDRHPDHSASDRIAGRGSDTLTSPFSRLAKVRRVLHRGEIALQRGDLSSAERAGRRVVARLDLGALTELRPAERKALIAGLELRACARRELTDFAGAAALHKQALGRLEDAPEAPDLEQFRFAIHLRLGEVLRLLGRFPEAEDNIKRAIELADDRLPPDPIARAMAINDLGILYKDTQRFEQAEEHYRQALHLLEQTLGPDRLELAPPYHNLAGLEHAQERFTEGEPFARHAIEIRAKHEGLETTGAAGDLAVLGALLLGQRRYAEAEQALQESLTIWQNRYGEKHYEVAVVRHNLAALHAARGQHQQAERAYRQVLDIKIQVLGPEHPDVVALKNYIDGLC